VRLLDKDSSAKTPSRRFTPVPYRPGHWHLTRHATREGVRFGTSSFIYTTGRRGNSLVLSPHRPIASKRTRPRRPKCLQSQCGRANFRVVLSLDQTYSPAFSILAHRFVISNLAQRKCAVILSLRVSRLGACSQLSLGLMGKSRYWPQKTDTPPNATYHIRKN
jgi:hypothetical protein